MKRLYFPNLNGLRFIAASLVVFHHVEQMKWHFGLENYWENPFFRNAGRLGVVLFFVLSGFLITYLLLEEQRKTGTVSIRDFYIRRILRIWALYYLIVLLSLFVLPHVGFFAVPGLFDNFANHFWLKAALFIFFLPNLAGAVFPPVPYASQAWSIGVEEQFYFIQPWLVKKFKNLPVILSVVALSYLAVKVLGMLAEGFYSNFYLTVFNGFWQTLNFDCLAIGGLAAVVLHKEKGVLKVLFKKYVQLIILVLTTLFILLGVYIPYVHEEFYALLFAAVILNLAANKETILNLENAVFSYLGKISYGLYMYHGIAIVIAIKFLTSVGAGNLISIYILSFALTILISAVSYHLFEHKFISLKSKFSKIITGDNAVETAKY